MNNQWSLISQIFSRDELAELLEAILSRAELLKTVASLGLSYPGIRLSSIPQYELIDAVLDESYSNPLRAKEFVKIIRKKVKNYSTEIEKLSVTQMKPYFNQLVKKELSLKELSMIILALLFDERAEVTELIPWFLEKILKLKPKSQVVYDELIEREKRLSVIVKEKGEINKRLNMAIGSLKEENKGLSKNLSKIKKENEDLKMEIERLNSLIKEPSESAELKHLEKDLTKILYSIEKIFHNEESLINLPERLELTVLKGFSELNEKLDEIRAGIHKDFAIFKDTVIEESKKSRVALKVGTKEESKKPIRERVAIFVDAQNLYCSAKRNFNGKVSYEKLLSIAVGNRHLIKAYAYVVKSLDGDVQPFITLLEKIGYEAKIKEPRYRADGSAKANWDMGIALDILGLLDKVDTVIIASGDGDFMPLVEHIKSKGKRVEIYAFSQDTAYDLQENADLFYPLDEKIALI